MRKADTVLVAAFDGSPELAKAIASGVVVGSGMQQPFLMGQRSFQALNDRLNGKTPPKEVLVPILPISTENIRQMLPTILKTVFPGEKIVL